MEKRPYYVSVQQGRVLPDKTATPYEFEILATEEEAEALQKLFEPMPAQDFANFTDAHVPYIPYHQRKTNDVIDNQLSKIYEKIYELGTSETRQFMEEHNYLGMEKTDL